MLQSRVSLVTCLTLVACGSAQQEPTSAHSAAQGLVLVRPEPAPSDICPQGGYALYTGTDRNTNGVLDLDEVEHLHYLCNEDDTAAAAGAPCSVIDNDDETKTLTCSDGTSVVLHDGAEGEDGTNGVDGANGSDGADGRDGVDGVNGQDGIHGADGNDGQNGRDGVNGQDGTNGADGNDGLGRDGQSCSVRDNGDGTATMTCPDGTAVTWPVAMAQASDPADGEQRADASHATPDPTARPAVSLEELQSQARVSATGDLDADGTDDAVVCLTGVDSCAVHLSTMDFRLGQVIGSNSTSALLVVDIDSDGDMDLLEGQADAAAQVWTNAGAQLSASHALLSPGITGLTTGDVNADGLVDLAALTTRGEVSVWLGPDFHRVTFVDGLKLYGVAFSDVNSDGYDDLVLKTITYAEVYWYSDGAVIVPACINVYRDSDRDRFGSDREPLLICDGNTPAGYIQQGGDCDDSRDSGHDIYPGAREVLNGIDDNCDGRVR